MKSVTNTNKKIKKISKAKSPLIKEIFQIKKDFLDRNYKDSNINWPVSIKILTQLFELINDLLFWKQFNLAKPYPIYWLYSQPGKAFLLQQHEKFLKNNINIPLAPEPERFNINNEKFGEDIAVFEKPKTLKDFLQ